ncbi:MAG: ABC transporter permease [Lachnospiraceae bacterium]|nr:ABC transporter permease [Lachnospiraceae bacterium]
MQVFKSFLKILNRNKISLIVYLVVFMILLISMAGNGEEASYKGFQEAEISFAAFNEDQGEFGKYLIDYLSQNNEKVEIENDKDVLMDAMFYRNIDCVITIPKDFTERIVAGEKQALIEVSKINDLQYGELAISKISEYISAVQIYLNCGYEVSIADEKAREQLKKEGKVLLEDGSQTVETQEWVYYFSFAPYIIICLIMLGIGPILNVFSEKNINMRNNCSATKLLTINLQKILGCVVFVVLAIIVFSVGSMILYPEFMFTIKGLIVMINLALFSFIALAITVLAVQYAKNSTWLNIIANTLGIVLCFLGGVFVPVTWFGENLIKVCRLLPTYWYVKCIESIQTMEDGAKISTEIWGYYGILVLFIIAIFAVSLVIAKGKQQKI